MNRRKSIKNLLLGISGYPFIANAHQLASPFSLGDKGQDIDWEDFAKNNYNISSDFVNLEGGYFGVQPNVVLSAYKSNIDKVNQYSSAYMRREFYQRDYVNIKNTLAEFSGVSREELLITRNATEALNILIQGLAFKKGDEVILQHHDYPSMIDTFKMLEARQGIKLKFLKVPLVPKNQEELLELYRGAITKKTRCILVTHLTHLTRQILPVKQIGEMAKSQGIDVIVDAAHSFAQLDMKLPDLGADFVGVNLHKWFGNPLGAGLMYAKKDRIKDLKPLFGDVKRADDDIDKLGHYGTPATPIVMTIPSAARFNQELSLSAKENRLRFLKTYWAEQAKEIDRVAVTTPLDDTQSCALASFKISGMEASDVVDQLYEKHQVFTVIRKLHEDTVVRVTPNLYNTTNDLDQLLEGIYSLAKS